MTGQLLMQPVWTRHQLLNEPRSYLEYTADGFASEFFALDVLQSETEFAATETVSAIFLCWGTVIGELMLTEVNPFPIQ